RGTPIITCRGAAHLASPGSFLLLNPDEPHEGRSEIGRAYRMMYVEPKALARLLDPDSLGLRSNPFPLFRSPIVEDRRLAAEYLRMHSALETGLLGALEVERRMLTFLPALVGPHAEGRIVAPDSRHTPLVRSIRQYLEAHFHEDLSLSDLSELTG